MRILLQTSSNGRIGVINRRIKQIGRTAYGYGNSLNYFFRVRLQLSIANINSSLMNLITKKVYESNKIINFTNYLGRFYDFSRYFLQIVKSYYILKKATLKQYHIL
ncbi:transposase [Weissella paramesenteroides]|nr:transposase [Weissella paramesenteroides]KAA8456683.1 transposase [Weissella paramesenteroides]KAA8459147.1 transposase [Weissella paramesenteroides]KAA8463553.1 transposase [Weissella paramesenteroides]KAA8465864.1 transposase [Weissella paramesenteroides]